MNTVKLRLLHPETDAVLEVSLPGDTKFGALNAVLYEHDFVYPQKPGYGFLIHNHLCGANHCLENYLPQGADTLEIQVFEMPQIMV